MRATTVLIVLTCWSSVLAAPPEPKANNPVEELLKDRDKQRVCVVYQGQYFHRYDHLLVFRATSISPEAAIEQGYDPCPECTPPTTSKGLVSETGSKAKGTQYYSTYLTERLEAALHPISTGGPGGAPGTSGPPGALFGGGLLGGVGQGLGTATAVSGAYNSVFVR